MNVQETQNTEKPARPATALYDRLSKHPWATGFHGPYAECICAILSYAGRSRTLREVVEILPHFDDQYELIDLLSSMANLGYYGSVREGSLASLHNDELPCLFVPAKRADGVCAPCAVLAIQNENGERVAQIYSTRSKKIESIKISRLRKPVQGRLHCFVRAQKERAENAEIVRQGTGYGWFRTILIRFYKFFAQIFGLSFAINILGLAAPLFVLIAYDRVISAQMLQVLPYLLAGVSIAIISEWRLRKSRSIRMAWIAARIDNIIGNLSFTKLINLPIATTAKASVTAQILRLRSIESLRDFFSSAAAVSVIELPFVIVYLTAIAVWGGYLVLAPIVCILLYGIIYFLMQKKINVEMRRTAKAGAADQRFLLETFSKSADVQSLGLVRKWAAKYDELSTREFQAFANLNFAGSTAEIFAQMVTTLGGVATIAFGGVLVASGSLSPGALIACLILTWKVLAPFHNFCAVIQRIEQLRNSVRQVDALMELDAKQRDEKYGSVLRMLRGEVKFEHVGLRLDDNQSPILLNASFHANRGDSIGITGQSGTGKSLLLQMVLGMYPATFGNIRIDGFNIAQLNTDALRKLISYVPQRTKTTFGTIEDNIRFVKPEATSEEVWNAIDLAGARGAVENLPEGINTRVELERRISPGLLVQISLARAFLLDSPLMLIDDIPHSTLCSLEGEALLSYIRRNRGVKTFIIASQNADLLRLCSRVFELTPLGLKAADESSFRVGNLTSEVAA